MSVVNRLRHGELDAAKNLVFWSYGQGGAEIWVTPAKFIERRQSANRNARKKYWINPDESRKKLREWHHENRDKKSKSFKNWAVKNKQKLRDKRLSRTYGISNETYVEMFGSQLGLCAICGQEQQGVTKDGNTRFLCVDHCHKTGAIRQLLCVKCNTGIGQFNDDPDLLKSAMAYLRRHKEINKSEPEQYQFQMQQAQNAEIGKIGTAPAQMGGIKTQGMQQ